ncbi:hypothetical protein FCM35_KLT11679 [Carex littledalei]|uniref:Glycosyl hydrolase family 32 N-terminal domain-containing protein n=1 Tax=Carex littledalei TaxID=544730 RepID=A0A833QRP8_9POAL|nr:hypothetical protein FCM35_KLT11679 [Carex littledalei]
MAVTSAPRPNLLPIKLYIPQARINPRIRHCWRCHGEGHPVGAASTSPRVPSPPGLIFRSSSDISSVGFSVVKRHVTDVTERWLMWYGTGSSIGLATSNNGIHWEETTGESIQPSPDWWVFDNFRVVPSDVLIMSSDKLRFESAVYWMYYTGFTEEKVELPLAGGGVVCKSLPGLAISQDGQHWARIEGEHHTGALFDAGEAAEWDSLFIAGPKVVYHGNKDLRMYYHSFDVNSSSYAIGIARSMDGLRWVKLGKVLERGPIGSFDDAGVRNGHVVWDGKNKKYLMVYEGIGSDGRTGIGLAESADGLKNWRRCTAGPLLTGSMDEEGWDCEGVAAPCLIQLGKGEGWRIYYTGIGKEVREGIGLAVCEELEPGKFVKWKSFQI